MKAHYRNHAHWFVVRSPESRRLMHFGPRTKFSFVIRRARFGAKPRLEFQEGESFNPQPDYFHEFIP